MKFKEYYKLIGVDSRLLCLMGCDADKEVTIEDCIISYNILKNMYNATVDELCWHKEAEPDEDGDYIIAYKTAGGSREYGWAVWDGNAWDVMCDFNPNGDEIQGWKKIGWYGD